MEEEEGCLGSPPMVLLRCTVDWSRMENSEERAGGRGMMMGLWGTVYKTWSHRPCREVRSVGRRADGWATAR